MEVKEELLCLWVLSYDKPHAPPVTAAAHSGIFVLPRAIKSSYTIPLAFLATLIDYKYNAETLIFRVVQIKIFNRSQQIVDFQASIIPIV